MKRIATISLAALLAVALAVPAVAAELNVKGSYKVGFIYREMVRAKDGGAFDRYWVHQNSNVAFTFTLDEDTKVVFDIGTPNSRWGGDLRYGGDNTKVTGELDVDKDTGGIIQDVTYTTTNEGDRRLRLSYSYVDWKFPSIGLSTRIGLQQFATPGFALGPVVINWKMPGVTLNKTIGDVAAVNLAWMRLSDRNGTVGSKAVHDEFDMFFVSVPVRLEGMTFVPWGEYSFIGKDTDQGSFAALPAAAQDKWTMWHAGFTTDLKFGDVFVKADFIYGKAEADKADYEIKGYHVAAKGGIKLGFGSPTVSLWYTSGNDKKDVAKGEYGMMPVLFCDGDPNFWPTSAGARAHGPLTTGFLITSTGIGTAGVALALENMSFVDKLFHTPRIAYWTGTGDRGVSRDYPLRTWAMAPGKGGSWLSEDDSAIEVNFDSRYSISQNLTMFLDLGYIYFDWDKKGPDGSATKFEKNAWRAGTSLIWNF